jgi:hypothetical protein
MMYIPIITMRLRLGVGYFRVITRWSSRASKDRGCPDRGPTSRDFEPRCWMAWHGIPAPTTSSSESRLKQILSTTPQTQAARLSSPRKGSRVRLHYSAVMRSKNCQRCTLTWCRKSRRSFLNRELEPHSAVKKCSRYFQRPTRISASPSVNGKDFLPFSFLNSIGSVMGDSLWMSSVVVGIYSRTGYNDRGPGGRELTFPEKLDVICCS